MQYIASVGRDGLFLLVQGCAEDRGKCPSYADLSERVEMSEMFGEIDAVATYPFERREEDIDWRFASDLADMFVQVGYELSQVFEIVEMNRATSIA